MAALLATAAAGSSTQLVVAYWNIRGLCAPLRMMCYFSGHAKTTTFRNYDAGSPKDPEYKQSWFKGDKPALLEANALMNLPYLIDSSDGETITVCQTNAIVVYLAEKFDLQGRTRLERARAQQILCQTMDLRNAAVSQFYSGGDEERFNAGLAAYPDSVRAHYAKLEGFLAQTGTSFAAADVVTFADFHLFEMLDAHEVFAQRYGLGSFLAVGHPRLSSLHARMRALPALDAYFKSEHASLPINNPHAIFR